MSGALVEFLENQLLKDRGSAVQVKQSDCYVPGSESQYVERIRKLLVAKFGVVMVTKHWDDLEIWLQVLRKLICIIHDESGKWVLMDRDQPRDFQPELKRIYLARDDGGHRLTNTMVDLVHRWFQKVFMAGLYLRGNSAAQPNMRRFIVPGIYFTGILGLLYILNKSRY